MSRLGNTALAFVAKAVLDRIGDRSRAAAAAERDPAGAHAPGTERPPHQPGLLAVMLASLVAGVALMVLFEATLTRIAGVALLFTFIVSGVFLIADPEHLGRDD